jgi:hypothetical protein
MCLLILRATIPKNSFPSELPKAILRILDGEEVSADLASNIIWATRQACGTSCDIQTLTNKECSVGSKDGNILKTTYEIPLGPGADLFLAFLMTLSTSCKVGGASLKAEGGNGT